MNSRSHDRLEQELIAQWLEAADVGLCSADDEDRAVMMNKAACRLLDVDYVQALNRPLRNLFRGVDDSEVLLEWLTFNGGADVLPVVHSGHTGRRHLQLKRRRVTHALGEQFKIIAITDVTAVVEAQQRLELQRREEAQYRQWQALNAGVVVSDALLPDMPIIYVNPAFERMSGYPSSEVLGRNCRFLQGHESDQPTLGPLRRALESGNNGYAVLRNYRKDGSLFINELFVSPVKDSNGRVIQFVGIQHLRSVDGSPVAP